MSLLLRSLLLVAAGLVFFFVAGIVAVWAPDKPLDLLVERWAPPPSQFLAIGGMQVHLRDEGPRDDPYPIVLLHGTSDSLHTWDGWATALRGQRRVIRFDLPGFGLTGPDPRADYAIDAYVRFVLAVLDTLGVQQVVLGGNSLGGQIAWQTAYAQPQRVRQLVLVGTAFPMKVSPTLLQLSLDDPGAAIDMVNVFSRSTLAPPPSALGPGTWVFGGNRALMHHVMASNPSVNLFHAAFKACNDYGNGLAAMAAYPGPVLFALGRRDQMTPPRAAQALIGATAQHRVAMLEVGHHQMLESPDALLAELRQFLKP